MIKEGDLLIVEVVQFTSIGYIYMHADETMGGTHFARLRVKQRDADPFNNGTRFVSHYKNSGVGFFSEVPISDAGSSA